jgi:hypothetical protein
MCMTIHVTQAHIDQSKRMLGKVGTFLDKFCDPITLAIREALKGNRCMTHPRTAEVDGVFYEMSEEAWKWTNDWCQGNIGQPFSFTLTHVAR